MVSLKSLRITRRELASLRSEKTIVLALLIQLFIAAFSSFLVVGLVSLYDPGSVSAGVGLEFGVSGDAGEDLRDAVEGEGGWSLVDYGGLEEAREGFRVGEVDAVLHAESGEDGRISVTAIAPRSSLRTTLVVVQVKRVLETFERERREELSSRLSRVPVELPPEEDASPYYGFTYTVLIPLLMLLPVFISGSIASDSVTEELERGTLELLRVSPLSVADVLDGKVLAMTLLAPLQAAVWLGLLAFNRTAVARPVVLLVLVTGFSLAVSAFGAGAALVFRDRKQSQFVYSVGLLAAFAVTYLFPESPPNTIARFAIGSASSTTLGLLVLYVLGGVAVYLGLRWVVGSVWVETD